MPTSLACRPASRQAGLEHDVIYLLGCELRETLLTDKQSFQNSLHPSNTCDQATNTSLHVFQYWSQMSFSEFICGRSTQHRILFFNSITFRSPFSPPERRAEGKPHLTALLGISSVGSRQGDAGGRPSRPPPPLIPVAHQRGGRTNGVPGSFNGQRGSMAADQRPR